ncbi:hypothetical protein HC031_21890 [Planosporangium thailandense]|uniref:Cupin domain-containing protein n=1 Tax=Planosporangium thailandense TaxID=765197 RepID=A0ABX0Y2V2_9ACTN|nr:hypothetical protein [Planosporangium thailandense]NJC72348.1 hypothetical protein [Planosporangium thailandense]
MDKVRIRRLPVVSPPVPDGGGRVVSSAGELAQIVNGVAYRFLAYVEFRPDAPRLRGNHFHERKTEIMYLIQGRLLALYEDVDTGERSSVELTAGDLVTIEPRCAHVYRVLEHAHAVELSTTEYDPDDTQRYQLAAIVDG